MKEESVKRLEIAAEVQEAIRAELTPTWSDVALDIAPGSEIIEEVLKIYGFRYKKELDGQRLAEKIDPGLIDIEIRQLLRDISIVS